MKLITVNEKNIHFINKFNSKFDYSSIINNLNNSIFDNINKNNSKKRKTLFKYLKLAMLQYYKNSDYDKALKIYSFLETKLSDFGEEIKPAEKGKLLESAGLCYFKKEFYKKSEDYYNKAIKYFSKKKNLNQIHQNFADLFYKSNNSNKALNSVNLARKYIRKSDYLAMMKVNNTEALIYSKMKKYKKAKSFSYNALEQAILSKNKYEEATARVNLSKILIKLNEYEQVNKMLKISKDLSIETENKNALISTYFYQGENK